MSSNSSKSGGIGCISLFTVLLQVLFIGLKLTGSVDWTWGQVFLPAIIYVGLTVVAILLILVIAFIVAILD